MILNLRLKNILMVIVYKSRDTPISKYLESSELSNNHLFIIGGDGTYLRALSDFKEGEVPDVYAFNDGKVGFLLPLNKENFEEIYDKITNKRLKFIERTRFNLISHNKLFCNEVVIRSKEFRLNTFNIRIDDFSFEIQACEMIISTPSGSTGYSLSLNGPIVHVNSLILNSSAPNRCFFAPIILPANSNITIESQYCNGWVDGIEIEGNIFSFKEGDKYKVYVDDNFNSYSSISQIIKSLKN